MLGVCLTDFGSCGCGTPNCSAVHKLSLYFSATSQVHFKPRHDIVQCNTIFTFRSCRNKIKIILTSSRNLHTCVILEHCIYGATSQTWIASNPPHHTTPQHGSSRWLPRSSRRLAYYPLARWGWALPNCSSPKVFQWLQTVQGEGK